jgi:hypothetical protein
MSFSMQLRRRRGRRAQRGYSLIMLIFALAVSAVYLTFMVDDVRAGRQRDLEAEFIARGCSVAKAIARYNNGGQLGPFKDSFTLPFKLEDLTKEYNLPNGAKMFLLRPSAINDPFTGKPWRVVRVGDPLLKKYIDRFESEYQIIAPQNVRQVYLSLANSVSAPKGIEIDINPGGDGDESAEVTFTESKNPIVGVVGSRPDQAFSQVLGQTVSYREWLFIYGPVSAQGQAQQILRNRPPATPCERTFLF